MSRFTFSFPPQKRRTKHYQLALGSFLVKQTIPHRGPEIRVLGKETGSSLHNHNCVSMISRLFVVVVALSLLLAIAIVPALAQIANIVDGPMDLDGDAVSGHTRDDWDTLWKRTTKPPEDGTPLLGFSFNYPVHNNCEYHFHHHLTSFSFPLLRGSRRFLDLENFLHFLYIKM